MCEKHLIDQIGIGDIVRAGLEASRLASSAPPLDPLEQEYEAEYRTVKRLSQVVNLLHLDTLDPKVVDEKRKQAWVALQLEPGRGTTFNVGR